jgi:hypothetical protein
MNKFFPKKNNDGSIGKLNGTSILKSWLYGCFKYIGLNGILYTPPAADGTNGQVLKTNGSGVLSWTAAGGATALDDVGDPDADTSIDLAGYKFLLNSTLATAGAVFTIKNTVADLSADVSLFDFLFNDDGDANGYFARGYDHAYNDLKWSIGADGAVTFGAATLGSAAIAGNETVGGTLDVTGAGTVGGTLGVTGVITGTAGATLGTSKIITETTNLTSAQVKALKATPIALTAAPGADKFIQLIGATLVLDYGSNAFTESSDDLVIEYETSGVDATAAITSNGFLTATADTLAVAVPAAIAGAATASFNGKKLMLLNSGDGEIAGNAANDSQLTVQVTYAVHTLGLA